MNRGNLKIGDRVRVRIKGRKTSSATKVNATSLVRETAGGNPYYTHLLFLRAGSLANEDDSGMVTAEFDAVITGDYQAGDFGTTAVREERPDGGRGYTHYLYLGSSSVSLLPEDPAEVQALAGQEDGTVLSADIALTGLTASRGTPLGETVTINRYSADIALTGLTASRGTPLGETVTINRYDDEITYRMVQDRIEDLGLDTDTTYTVVRVRNDEELAQFSDEDEAREYIDENDYNPDRVIVRESDPDPADVDELEMLGVLNSDCDSKFARSWASGDVTLRRIGYFDRNWARGEAASLLNVNNDDLDGWPLSQVDWDDAAGQRLANDYLEVTFDNETYYGRDI